MCWPKKKKKRNTLFRLCWGHLGRIACNNHEKTDMWQEKADTRRRRGELHEGLVARPEKPLPPCLHRAALAPLFPTHTRQLADGEGNCIKGWWLGELRAARSSAARRTVLGLSHARPCSDWAGGHGPSSFPHSLMHCVFVCVCVCGRAYHSLLLHQLPILQ